MNDLIGMDASKASLDAFSPANEFHRQFTNDARGITRLIGWADKTDDPLIVFEATGAHHRLLVAKINARGIPLHKVNPRRTRRFAQATDRPAKTDRMDADMPGGWERSRTRPPSRGRRSLDIRGSGKSWSERVALRSTSKSPPGSAGGRRRLVTP